MAINVTTKPSKDPVELEDAKAYLRVVGNDDDATISRLIKTAAEHAEDHANIALITQTIEQTCDLFPAGDVIKLERPPLISVTSVSYYDVDDALQTFSASKYQVVTTKTPGRVVLNDGESWPSTYDREDAVKVTYQAGYGSDQSDIPMGIKQAIMSLVNHWYDHRDVIESMPGIVSIAVPLSFNTMMDKYKVHYF